MKAQARVVKAECLDGLFHHHLVAGDGEAGLGHRLGDIARGNGSEELTHFRSGANHADGEAVHLAGFGLCLATAGQVVSFTLGLFGFETLEVVLVGAKGLALRQQEVAGVARLHLHDIAHLAELLDAFKQNDFHCPMSPLLAATLRGHVRHQGKESCPLDGNSQLALLLGRNGRDARRHDLAALGCVARKQLGVLVVDDLCVRSGKRARLATAAKRATDGFAFDFELRHDLFLAAVGGRCGLGLCCCFGRLGLCCGFLARRA